MTAKSPTPSTPLQTPYRPTYRDEHRLATYLIDSLEHRLAGREATRRSNVFPTDWCLIGMLAPQRDAPDPPEAIPEQPDGEQPPIPGDATTLSEVKTPAAPASPTPNESKSDDEAGAEPAPRERPDEQRIGRRTPSALGLELLLKPDSDGKVTVRVDVTFSIFTRHLPTLAEQVSQLPGGTPLLGSPLVEVTHRWPIAVEGLVFSLKPQPTQTLHDDGDVQKAIDDALKSAFSRPDAERDWPPRTRPTVDDEAALKDQAAFARFIAEATKNYEPIAHDVRGSVEVRAARRPDGLVRLGCYIRNTATETPRGERNRGQRDAFRHIGDARLSVSILAGEVEPIEILPVPRDYQYDRRVWGVGHNTSVVVNREARTAETRALARFEQPRIATQDKPEARFSELAVDPIGVLTRIERAMRKYLQSWRDQVIEQNSLRLTSAELLECRRDLEGFDSEVQRLLHGVAALQADQRLLEAFKATNRVFGRLARGYESWRLFQIVFIATQLPALAIREGITRGKAPGGESLDWSDCLDVGDVLWFRTGGGKTEAYLGLTCCAMLYDRLRGKTGGVTAWLRLPLRMLSVQQLQRAMGVIWEAEAERKQLLGKAASTSDPFRLGYFVGSGVTPNAIWSDAPKRYGTKESLEKLRVIADCPACRAAGSISVSFDKDQWRFRHICSKCCAELPLDISDDEVYRNLPTLLVGTVDKMASVGQQAKFGRLWGGVGWRCQKHGYSAGKYCAVFGCDSGKRKRDRIDVKLKDPAPALHIQDELHLLQEELGAFAGHYETLIRFCEKSLSGLPSKIIAATATIEGFEHQVRDLYGTKRARRFPGRGYDKNSSFYAGPDLDEHGSEKTGRIFAALKSVSLSQAKASARVSELLQEEVTRLMRNPHLALAFLRDARTTEDVHALLRYYTTTLNYVSSLAKGSIVKQELEDATSRIRGQVGRDLNVVYTSSRTPSAEVVDVVHKIENPPGWDDAAFLDALVATSMISHGVDLERVNIMVMDGVPEETAEYIQASSRSGRRHIGLVVVVLADYVLRSASIYHRFIEYHQHLDRMVSPVPVNRFAKYAAERTLPGIAVGLLYGLHIPRDPEADLGKRVWAEKLISALGSKFLTELHGSYFLGTGVYDTRLEAALAAVVDTGANRVRMHLQGSPEEKTVNALRPRPMSSLRDVDLAIPFWPKGGHNLLTFIERTRE